MTPRVSNLETELDIRPRFRYKLKISLIEGRIPDAI